MTMCQTLQNLIIGVAVMTDLNEDHMVSTQEMEDSLNWLAHANDNFDDLDQLEKFVVWTTGPLMNFIDSVGGPGAVFDAIDESGDGNITEEELFNAIGDMCEQGYGDYHYHSYGYYPDYYYHYHYYDYGSYCTAQCWANCGPDDDCSEVEA